MSDNSAYLSSVRTFSTAYRPGDQSGALFIAAPDSLTRDEVDEIKRKFEEQFVGFVPLGVKVLSRPRCRRGGVCIAGCLLIGAGVGFVRTRIGGIGG